MRIALFTEMYLSEINGVVTHVKSLAAGLRKLGHDVLIVTADAHADRHYLADGVLHCPAITMRKIYGYGAATPVSMKRLRYLRTFRPDIIHIHTEFGVGLSGVAIAKLLRKPLVYTLHTLYDNYVYYVSPRAFLGAATYLTHSYLKLVARSANRLLGPSRKCEEFFHLIKVHKPFTLIHNPVDLELFQPGEVGASGLVLRREAGLEGKTAVCFVGRLGTEKNVNTLLDFWAESITESDNLHLIVVGDGPSREDLVAQAEALGLSGMVTFVGSVAHEALPDYYRICRAYITASLTDTNSISMLEGMASGLPVLQLLDHLNEEQIKEGVNGFIFENAAEMAAKLRKIRDMSQADYDRLQPSVLASAYNNSEEGVAAQVLTVYEDCLTHRKKTSFRRLKGSLRKTTLVPPEDSDEQDV